MRFRDVLRELEALGTSQNRKVYARHGVPDPMFGVSFGDQRGFARKLGSDPALAERLWASGNHDARVLATMIADPSRFSARDLDRWARDLDNYVLADAFSALVAQTRHSRSKADVWGRSKSEWIGQAGWNLVAHLALHDELVEDEFFTGRLETVESEIHDRANRVRHAMNQALIAIGLRNPPLRKLAIAAAGRIGRVEVDHGATSCKTPDAAGYIRKAIARRRRRQP